MRPRTPDGRSVADRDGWLDALLIVLGALIAMGVVAGLGLWAAGAAELPDNAFGRVVAATVVTSVGGTVEVRGDAGGLARTDAHLVLLPLSVTVTGALVFAAGFLRPLRHRPAVDAPALVVRAARIAVLWAVALTGLCFAARQDFRISLGAGAARDLIEIFGVSPVVGFTTDVPLTLLFGLLWLAGMLLLALLVSGAAPLPPGALRLRAAVGPAAYAMVGLLLVCVAVGVVVGLVVATSRGHPAETLAVLLLGLPNLVWLAFTIGLGATWHGRVDGPFALPMPRLLDRVLRGPDVSTLDLRSLAAYDGRVWWLVGIDAVLLLGAAVVMAVRSPVRLPLWRHAVRMAVALALTVLTVCLVGRVSVRFGLSVLGIGNLGGDLTGDLFLRAEVGTALGVAVLWGLVTGFLGGLLTRAVRGRPGRRTAKGPPGRA
ncbi:streptophobe family protein [Streptomyces sp. NPDC091377]|uniref:streptophobe family protein n=1 Tax=Streptomyces sp. NPDC091377 TaxID=3365995 RepID=UPI0037FF6028